MADLTRLIEVVVQVVNRSRQGTRQFQRQTEQITTATRNAQQAADRSSQSFRRLGTSAGQAGREVRNAGSGVRDYTERVKEAGQETQGFGQNVRSLIQTFTATGVFGLATRSAGEFSRQIAEVGTLVDDSVQSNEELRDVVRQLSNEFGQDRATVASALYQAISSGAEAGAEANELLNVALRLAIGGVTDARSAVDGLTTVLNAFQLQFSEAEKVADVLFTTVKNGRTTVEELSQFLFQAAPIANALGVSFEELSASIVGLTLQGTPARVAFTQIRAALLGVSRDTPELIQAFRDAGFASGEAALAQIGLADTLQILNRATGGSIAQIQSLVGTVEGAQAIAGLSGENFGAFAEALDQVNNAAGASQAAFEEVQQTLGQQFAQTLTQISNAFESIGNALAPVARVILSFVSAVADFVQLVAEQFPNATALVLTLVTALISLRGALLIVTGLRRAFVALVPQIALSATAAEGAAVSTNVLAASLTRLQAVLVRFVAPLAAVAAGYIAASEAIDVFIDKNDEALGKLRRVSEVQADILELREALEALGVDAAQLEQQLQTPFARAFAAQDPEIRRLRLEEIRDQLEARLVLETELGTQIQQERERLAQLAAQKENEIAEQQLEKRKRDVQELIRLDQDALRASQQRLRELVREEEQAFARIKAIRQESADFQKALDQEIAAIGAEEEAEEIKQARLTISLLQQIAAINEAIANAKNVEQANAARQQAIELVGQARQLQNEDELLLRLRDIQRLEEDATTKATQLSVEQIKAAQAAQAVEKQRIEDLSKGVAQLKEDLKAVGEPVEVDVNLQIEETNQALDQLEARLEELRRNPVEITVTASPEIQAGTTGPLLAQQGIRAQSGGQLPGYGGGDKVPVLGEAGEMIVNKERTSKFNRLLHAINSSPLSTVSKMLQGMAGVQRFQEGGVVQSGLAAAAAPAGGGVSSRVALDLTLNGQGPFALEGESRTIDDFIDELSEATRNLAGR